MLVIFRGNFARFDMCPLRRDDINFSEESVEIIAENRRFKIVPIDIRKPRTVIPLVIKLFANPSEKHQRGITASFMSVS